MNRSRISAHVVSIWTKLCKGTLCAVIADNPSNSVSLVSKFYPWWNSNWILPLRIRNSWKFYKTTLKNIDLVPHRMAGDNRCLKAIEPYLAMSMISRSSNRKWAIFVSFKWARKNICRSCWTSKRFLKFTKTMFSFKISPIYVRRWKFVISRTSSPKSTLNNATSASTSLWWTSSSKSSCRTRNVLSVNKSTVVLVLRRIFSRDTFTL